MRLLSLVTALVLFVQSSQINPRHERWYTENLRVWIQPSNYLGSHETDTANVVSAFRAWETVAGPHIFFVPDSINADVVVIWVDGFWGTNHGGITLVHYEDVGDKRELENAYIQLALHVRNGNEMGDATRIQMALHEAGHALGLTHSDDPIAIMYPTVYATSLSIEDKTRLRALYPEKSR